eukprot:764851-Hanusia_phi.AAC.15
MHWLSQGSYLWLWQSEYSNFRLARALYAMSPKLRASMVRWRDTREGLERIKEDLVNTWNIPNSPNDVEDFDGPEFSTYDTLDLGVILFAFDTESSARFHRLCSFMGDELAAERPISTPPAPR